MDGFLPVRHDAMCRAIEACHSVDEVKELHDKARALEIYARQAMNVEAERKACEVRLRSERRAGELLRELERATPQTANPSGKANPPATAAGGSTPYREALDRTGTSERTAQRWQELANVDREAFEAALANPDEKPTTAGIIGGGKIKRMDDDALWLWGTLRDVEKRGILRRDIEELLDGMTATMVADVRRIAPMLINWIERA